MNFAVLVIWHLSSSNQTFKSPTPTALVAIF